MKLAIFAKKRKSNAGKTFTVYLTTLTHKDGSDKTMQVKFKEPSEPPKAELCPMYIEVDRQSINLSTREYIREDTGETAKSYTMWVDEWQKCDEKYVDKTLDDFDIS